MNPIVPRPEVVVRGEKTEISQIPELIRERLAAA